MNEKRIDVPMSNELSSESPEEKESAPKPKIGDYVSAATVEKNYFKQGVFAQDNGDGTIVLKNEHGQEWVCKGPENITIVPDANIFPGFLEGVQKIRKELDIE